MGRHPPPLDVASRNRPMALAEAIPSKISNFDFPKYFYPLIYLILYHLILIRSPPRIPPQMWAPGTGQWRSQRPSLPKFKFFVFFGPKFPIFSEMFRMHPNASRCFRMHPNASEQVRTGPNRSENFEKRAEHSEKLAKHSKNSRKISKKFAIACLVNYLFINTLRPLINVGGPMPRRVCHFALRRA